MMMSMPVRNPLADFTVFLVTGGYLRVFEYKKI